MDIKIFWSMSIRLFTLTRYRLRDSKVVVGSVVVPVKPDVINCRIMKLNSYRQSAHRLPQDMLLVFGTQFVYNFSQLLLSRKTIHMMQDMNFRKNKSVHGKFEK